MARLTSTLARRIGLTVIGLHAILLPLLYYGVDYSVRSSHEDMFVNHVRAYSKILADRIEAGTVSSRDEDMTSFLDGLALGGEVTYAEFIQGERVIRSSLLPVSDIGQTPPEDYAFGRGKDNVYFVSTVLSANGTSSTLRLGFDETPTLEGISQTRRGVFISLGAYMVGSCFRPGCSASIWPALSRNCARSRAALRQGTSRNACTRAVRFRK